ncbi:MAG: DNA-directed RNA polymerase subunit alpha [Synergistaceae bacterium]|nr:DNA-directed RNA polymerase subunit alpha [Synergistaceae bacterium]
MEHARYEIIVEESTSSYGRVVIEPLERGYGVTLGNSLRRVLLSSISGAAITAIRVDGILHEFTTVPGVKEDMIELLMNIKHVPVRSYSSEFRILHLETEGPGVVTASDIQPDSEIEFPDPDAVICHLESGAKLSMDFYVESGTGYASLDRPRPVYLPVDALLVDAIFSPAQRVKYEVQDKRLGQRTDYDSLVLEIWTNGVVSPEEAIYQASIILRDYFMNIAVAISPDEAEALSEIKTHDQSKSQDKPGGDAAAKNFLKLGDNPAYGRPVRDLELSVRSENCLMRGGVHYIGELVSRSRGDLLKIRNLGKISLREIEEKLTKFDLTLSGEVEDDPEEDRFYK